MQDAADFWQAIPALSKLAHNEPKTAEQAQQVVHEFLEERTFQGGGQCVGIWSGRRSMMPSSNTNLSFMMSHEEQDLLHRKINEWVG